MTYAEKLKQGVATVEAYIEDTGTLGFLSAIADGLGIEIIQNSKDSPDGKPETISH